MKKVRLLLLGLLGAAVFAQSCPHLRYILFDDCASGGSYEGLNEHLIFFTPISFNINDLKVSFPVYPNQTNLDNDSPTRWVCYASCPYAWTCDAATIATMNSNACTGTSYTCPAPNTTIAAGSFIIVFTGVPNTLPDLSNFCGAGTVYVLFTNNTNGAGRYSNSPSAAQNRRTRIAFDGMPACSMTVNYRGSITAQNGNYLLIDPNVCIGLTEGQNNVTPSAGACYYSSSGSNGVSLGNAGAQCAIPPVSTLPIIWAELAIEGHQLRWHALEAAGPLSLWYQPALSSEAFRIQEGLPAVGLFPLSARGYYFLEHVSLQGARERSPLVYYAGEGAPKVLLAGSGHKAPYILTTAELVRIIVWDGVGREVATIAYPAASALQQLELRPGVYQAVFELADGTSQPARFVVLP